MKILMKKDLRKVGKRGDVIEVSDGYGANYLIPQGYGVLFTLQAKKDYEKELEKEHIENERKKSAALLIKEKLSKITLEYEANAGRRGEMIGTISFKEISEKLKKEYDISLDKKMIVDKATLVNGFGKNTIDVELFKGVIATINIHVTLKEKK